MRGRGRQPEGRVWDCCPAAASTAPLAWGQSLGDSWQVGHPVSINWTSARAWGLTGKPSLYCLKVGVLGGESSVETLEPQSGDDDNIKLKKLGSQQVQKEAFSKLPFSRSAAAISPLPGGGRSRKRPAACANITTVAPSILFP